MRMNGESQHRAARGRGTKEADFIRLDNNNNNNNHHHINTPSQPTARILAKEIKKYHRLIPDRPLFIKADNNPHWAPYFPCLLSEARVIPLCHALSHGNVPVVRQKQARGLLPPCAVAG